MGAAGPLRITVLGSGTSVGVPTPGCHCAVCTSADPRDNRLRPSVLLQYGGHNVVIDTTPDFRTQMLRAKVDHLDAVLFTHSHADHIMGLDDVRPFNFRQRAQIPIYASADTMSAIQRCFQYIFTDEERESSVPQLEPNTLNGRSFDLFGLEFTPIRLLHGRSPIYGFRFGSAAYLTDHSDIPAESIDQLRGLDVLFLDALRHKPHPTHSTVERSIQTVEQLTPKRAFFTHICHDLPHVETENALPPNIRLAYDGLEITVEGGREVTLGGATYLGGATKMSAAFRLFHGLDEVPADFGPSSLTIGNFDGVHAGHRRILRRVRGMAEEYGWKASVLTFDPHPTRVVAPDRAPRLMTMPEQRCALMREEGIEQVLILPFSADVARLTPEEFVEQVLVRKLGARTIVVGENFRFGHKKAGDTHLLMSLGKRFGYTTEIVPAVSCRGRQVSSSGLRHLVEAGAVARAGRYLMRPYALEGEVVSGHGVGAKKTVPTLNLATRSEVLPKRGVYVTRTTDLDGGGRWESVTNIGYRPTFGGDDRLSIETFLLEPLAGPAPRFIRVEFLWRLRDEQKFESPDALKTQILKDVARAKAYFRRLAQWTRQTIFECARGDEHETVRR